MTCSILVSQLGIKPRPLAVRVLSPNDWTENFSQTLYQHYSYSTESMRLNNPLKFLQSQILDHTLHNDFRSWALKSPNHSAQIMFPLDQQKGADQVPGGRAFKIY